MQLIKPIKCSTYVRECDKHCMLDFYSRLFYLFQGSKNFWIKEDVLFHYLYWLSPVISAMVVMTEWVEAAYQINDPLLAYYRIV